MIKRPDFDVKMLLRCAIAFAALAIMALLVLCISSLREDNTKKADKICIAMPENEDGVDLSQNYYKMWLEKECDVQIEFYQIPKDSTQEYLHSLLLMESTNIDAVFFSQEEKNRITKELLSEYAEYGLLYPMTELIDQRGSYTGEVLKRYEPFHLRKKLQLTGNEIYYLPNMNTSKTAQNAQIFWLNTELLKQLGLSIPQTTAEFEEVLRAFQKAGKLPLAGAKDEFDLRSYYFILNSFVYFDREHSGIQVTKEGLRFVPASEEFREGLRYCRKLYLEGLLGEQNFDSNQEQLIQLTSDKRNLVGSFTAQGIDKVLYQNSPEVRSRYLYMEPLVGPKGVRYCVVKALEPVPGAIIPAGCTQPELVFRVLDKMLSEEASLIAKFGEQGVDWNMAGPQDISLYESKARINTRTYLGSEVQNKNFGGYGPFVVPAEYLDGVTWNGYNADQEYINARAMKNYLPYFPEGYPDVLYEFDWDRPGLKELRNRIDFYVDEKIEEFITGTADIHNDKVWEAWLYELNELGVADLLTTLEQSKY